MRRVSPGTRRARSPRASGAPAAGASMTRSASMDGLLRRTRGGPHVGARRRSGFWDLAGDEPRAASAGDEADRPADEDQDAVLQPDEVEEVDDEVGQPGRRAAQPQAPEVQHRPPPADRRGVALVEVPKRPVLPAV